MARHELTPAERLRGSQNGKRKPLNAAWVELLEAIHQDGGQTLLSELVRLLMSEARMGNIQAIKEVIDRAYGKAAQSIEVDITTDDPLIYTLKHPKEGLL